MDPMAHFSLWEMDPGCDKIAQFIHFQINSMFYSKAYIKWKLTSKNRKDMLRYIHVTSYHIKNLKLWLIVLYTVITLQIARWWFSGDVF